MSFDQVPPILSIPQQYSHYLQNKLRKVTKTLAPQLMEEL